MLKTFDIDDNLSSYAEIDSYARIAIENDGVAKFHVQFINGDVYEINVYPSSLSSLKSYIEHLIRSRINIQSSASKING